MRLISETDLDCILINLVSPMNFENERQHTLYVLKMHMTKQKMIMILIRVSSIPSFAQNVV